MSPELRARVEASVTGRRHGSGSRLAPRATMVLRVVALTSIVATLVWLVSTKRRADQETEALRSSLVERSARAAHGLTEQELAIAKRAASWLKREAQAYAGDLVTPRAASLPLLSGLLKQPTVYVRGPLAELDNSQGLERSARESAKDAFVLCLLDPPTLPSEKASRSEKAILARAKSAYAAGERMQQATGHITRLGDAYGGLPFLQAAWRERIAQVEQHQTLVELAKSFDRAPLDTAREALKSRTLLFAIDEPGERSAVSELDGEKPHSVRVGLIDLSSGQQLLRLRRRVDPSGLSEATRAEYARGVDDCSLALDVRQAVTES